MAINLTLFKQVTYDPDRDFIPISLYVKSPFILVVNPDLPAKTVPELIKYIKENQGKLSYSSPGAGVAQHLSMEYMKNQFGLEITHVPYRATPQSIQDIAAGHIALGWAEAGASLPLIKDGKLRALAVSSHDAAAAAARRAAARRSRACAGLRGGVVAHAARAGQDAARHRRQAARRDEAASWPSRTSSRRSRRSA